MNKILALNKSYIPIRLISYQSAIGKLYCEQCEFIYIKDNNWEGLNWNQWLEASEKREWDSSTSFIHTIKQRFAIPKVIRYTKYDKIPKVTFRLSRQAIYNRDNWTCYICGEEFSEGKLSIDHVVPTSRGGKNSWENMITCCKNCNYKKGDKLLSELGIKPKFLPHKPTISNIQKLKNSVSIVYPEWKLFGLS